MELATKIIGYTMFGIALLAFGALIVGAIMANRENEKDRKLIDMR